MSIYAGPNVISRGLVLNLDASNPRSYPRTGTNWFDVSGNNNNGILTNGPAYNAANKGILNFDGSNDYTLVSNLKRLNQFSVAMWLKRSGAGAGYFFFIGNLGSNTDITLYIGYTTSSTRFQCGLWDASANFIGADCSVPLPTGAWEQWVLMYNGGLAPSTSITFARNGSMVPQRASTPNASYTGLRQSDNVSTYVGYGRDGTFNIYFNGSIANTLVYNRVLSSVEISQNYNAVRERFGL